MSSPPVLTPDEARRLALWAQGFLGTPPWAGPARRRPTTPAARTAAVSAMLDGLGAVQLDTIAVLARSHELVAAARLGPLGRVAIEAAYWGDARPGPGAAPARTFEYWSHAACLLPVSEWPWFAFRRRAYARAGVRWHDVSPAAVAEVRARLRASGPATTADLGGGRRGGAWWDWSDAKIAVEWLLDTGEVAVVRREGWRRVYALAVHALPESVLDGADWIDADGVRGPDDATCLRRLVGLSGRALGVGTAADLADVHRLRVADVRAHAGDAGLVRVRVESWPEEAWAAPRALAWLSGGGRGRHRTTLLSPFDSLVWDRRRTARLFGVHHRLEAYTPAARRIHGYYAMPVLHRGRIVARVDPAREPLGPARSGPQVLVARSVTLETAGDGRPVRGAVAGTAAALAEAAAWVGAQGVRVDAVSPATARADVAAACRAFVPGGSTG